MSQHDSQTTKRRPPKKNLMDAVKLIDAEIERCKERAIRSQATADNPPNERVDPVYWQKDATAAIRKVHRLSIVTEWLEAESNAR